MNTKEISDSLKMVLYKCYMAGIDYKPILHHLPREYKESASNCMTGIINNKCLTIVMKY